MTRHDAPSTSHAAGASVKRLTHRQAVARVLALAGEPSTAQQLEDTFADEISPSSVRGCVKALCVDEKIVEVGTRPNRSGCEAKTWRWRWRR